MGKWIHRLSNIDLEAKIADCANCGRVKIRLKNGGARCSVAEHEHGKDARRKRNIEFPTNIQGKCPICLEEEKLIRDHNHGCCDKVFSLSCGECVRGYICHRCNVGLGMFRDDPEALRRAIDYLVQNSAPGFPVA